MLAPESRRAPSPAPAEIENAEHARTIEATRPPKRERPVIAILTLNEATEVTDFLVPFGVLKRADVADIIVVAERVAPVPLHPFSALGRGPALLSIDPQSTTHAFDEHIRRVPTTSWCPPWSRATIGTSLVESSHSTGRAPRSSRSVRAP